MSIAEEIKICYTKIVSLLDLIFPKYCVNCRKIGDYICPNCFAFLSFDFSMICLICNKGSIDGLTHPGCKTKYAIDGVFCAVSYKKMVKKLIYNFKYKPYLTDLRKSLVELFYESIIQQEIFQKAYEFPPAGGPILVPIPLHQRKLKQRGYNHSELLGQGLAEKLNLKLVDAMQRIKETKSQFGLNLKERKENLKNAFVLSSKFKVQGPNVFLVDDILTTGSTLSEAAKILKKNGAKKVWGLVFARD
jgi:competence protein ComFC